MASLPTAASRPRFCFGLQRSLQYRVAREAALSSRQIRREPEANRGGTVGIRFTNPWWVVAGAVTGLVVCNGPVMAFTFGVFLKPLMEDMGWQRGTASFALSFGGIFSALMVPVFGWMMDRWSIRRVALPGIVIYAFAIALLALSPRSFLAFT